MEGLITPTTSQYTDRPLNKSLPVVRELPFYCAFTFIVISALLVGAAAIHAISHFPELLNLFILQWVSMTFSFMMVGVGLSLPFLIVAGILGWGQFLLLLTGNIRPHLGSEGLINVLKILFSKI